MSITGTSEVRGHSPSLHSPSSWGRVYLKVPQSGGWETLEISQPLFTTHRLSEWKSTAYQGGIGLAHQVSPSSLNCRQTQWLPPGHNGGVQTTSKSSGLYIKDLLHPATKAAHGAPCEDNSKASDWGELHLVTRLSLEGLSATQRPLP